MPYSDISKQKQAQHESYLRNKEEILRKNRDRKRADRAWLASLKDNQPCVTCGIKYPSCVLDYHHKDRINKIASISDLVRRASREKVLKEISKCVLMCANCHRIYSNENKIFSTLGHSNITFDKAD